MGSTEVDWKRHGATDLSSDALGVRQLHSYGRHFVDGYGRIVQVRGMNVSGASKLPTKPNGLAPLTAEEFFAHDAVSFGGRPFALSEAPLHLARLQAWGHSLIRLLITWESISHAGPDPEHDMDMEYVEYLDKLIDLMSQFGLKVILCAHQDVWSRYSGGSGAPAWTFSKAGLDIEAFKPTGAAFIPPLSGDHGLQFSGAHASTSTKREPVGAFVWPSGYQKLAAATMATLFWAGERFAWSLQLPSFNDTIKKGDLNIQEYLQESYIESFGRLVDWLGAHEAVMGFDLMNEPHRGYVGATDWHKWCYETDLHIGHFPSMLQSLALGSGYKQEVPFYVKSWPFPTRRSHISTVDPLGRSAWRKGTGMGECVWRAHGAWQWDSQKQQAVVLCEDFFSHDPRPGKGKERIEWYRDCYAPFVSRFSARLHRTHKHLQCFVEPIPNEFFPPWSHPDTIARLDEQDRAILMKASFDQQYAVKTFISTLRPSHFVYAPHFYDLNVLFSKVHGVMSVDVQALSRGAFILRALFFDVDGLKQNYRRQIATLIEQGKTSLGAVPTIIGEVGVPFDINGGRALRTGDYAKQTELLDALIEAMEQANVGFTLWNYNPDNTTAAGDGWNQEDFSVMCNEQDALDLDNVCAPRSQEGRHQAATDDVDAELYRLHAGGRSLPAIIRPYAVKVAGFPVLTAWDREKLLFDFQYANPPATFHEAAMKAAGKVITGHNDKMEAVTTKLFVPRFHFDGYSIRVQISDGEFDLDLMRQTLSVKHDITAPGYTHKIRISVEGPIPPDQMTGSQAALMRNREAVRKRRHRRIRLTVSDWCAIVGVLLATIFALILSEVAANAMISKNRANAHIR